jgi:hypothetical protein
MTGHRLTGRTIRVDGLHALRDVVRTAGQRNTANGRLIL